ncbi:non-ribosomal peptide synthetase [Streptomyces sp. PTY087I2]|uniref:non-ribosomal peptide synthetase n=1 Tax=Streptomyces sp. PTY087I2 TaxID=1819298 RepID=UPI00080BB894|nr:non-ribosomal peptide synthetase [Streptomyces sp. PTY087I2]OCC14042.1 Phenyloxazoline synthase MbtB [Streptomyces sp. PTY087I2]
MFVAEISQPEAGTPGESEVVAAVCAVLEVPAEDIALDVDLFELGLDSLGLIRLTADWRRRGLKVTFEELAEASTLRRWIEILRDAGTATSATAQNEVHRKTREQEPASTDEGFPLGVMQHAYWIGRQDDQPLGGVGAHFYAELDGAGVDPERLDRAVAQLRRRHEMLRVTVLDDGHQRIRESVSGPSVVIHDLTGRSGEELNEELGRLRDLYTHRRMDVEKGQVFDVALSLLPDGATRLHIDLDMVAADAASMRVLLRDLRHLYARPNAPLPEISGSYRDYLETVRSSREGDRADARKWWQQRLPELSAPPQLPTVEDPLSPAAAGSAYHHTTRLFHRLDASRKQVLLERARRHRLTPTAVLAAAFAEVIAAWSAEPRFLLNLPLFHRDLGYPGAADMVGDFSSSVLLDVDLTGEKSFAAVANEIQTSLRTVIARGAYSGVEVLRDLTRAAGGTPVLAPVVYTSALGLGEVYDHEVRHTFGEPTWIISQGPQVWLDAQVTELDEGLLLNWDVRDALFEPGVPEAAFDAYRRLLETLLDDEGAWSLPAPVHISETQRSTRAQANDTDAEGVEELLHQGFHRAASRSGERVAIIDESGRQVTYGELAERAGRLTALLTAEGVRPGDSVAISLPRGVGQVAAVLGVLGAGATYVPIGLDQPAERVTRILDVASVAALLTDAPHLDAERGTTAKILSVEQAEGLRPAPPFLDQPVESIAYVIFTSGSTGIPKGVEVSHGAAMNTIVAINKKFDVNHGDRSLALAGLDFDMSVYDLFGPLSAGGSVVLIGEGSRRDADHWVRLIREHGVTVVNCVPALLEMIVTAAESSAAVMGESLRLTLLGGDWVGLDLPGRLRRLVPEARFVALGGMTEAAVHSTVFEVDEVDPRWSSVPWGVPLDNMRTRVADFRGRDAPDWVPGELWVSGAGLAAGYRGDEKRTAERFVEHEGRRWYRTGDRARYRSDGVLEFLGRIDHQVKLRGHRIELGEVEAAASGIDGVSACVAQVMGAPRRLVLAVASMASPTLSPDVVLEELARLLPPFMVPSHVLVLDSLPLTANGKPDRAKVAALAEARASDGGDEERGETPLGWAESVLAQVWSELLGVSDIRRGDNFFGLGGDSLLATRLIAALRARGVGGAKATRLFANPGLAEFAEGLFREDQAGAQALGPGDPERRHEPFPPTDVQRAFLIGRDDRLPLGGVGTYHYSEFDGADVDIDRLQQAWRVLIERHEMLRAVFDAEGQQRILPEVPDFVISVTDVATETEAVEALERLRTSASHARLDVTQWPLFDLQAVRYPQGGGTRTRVALGLDYIVLDGASIIALHGELDALYSDLNTPLPPIDVSFRDYVLEIVPEKDDVERARAHWLRRLDELPPAPALPLAVDPSTVSRPWFTRRSRPLEAERWETLRAKARHHGLTPSAVLLICYVDVLSAWSDQAGVTVNLTLFNRLPVHPHIYRVVGDFTSVSLVGHAPQAGETWLEAAHRLQRVMGEDLDHREASAIWLMQELARRTGTVEAAMPVVFSSSVGVGDIGVKDLSETFPAKVHTISQTPQVMLDNQVTESRGGIMVSWDAVEDLFRPGVLDAMFHAYNALLDHLVDHDWEHEPPSFEQPSFPALDRSPRPSAKAPCLAGTLHADVLRKMQEAPDLTALRWPGGSMTYGELEENSARVASGLIRQGVGPGNVVAISLPRGPGQVVAALGTLRTGAAFAAVPADDLTGPTTQFFRAVDARLVIEDTPAPDAAEGIISTSLAQLAEAPAQGFPVVCDPASPAYVIVLTGQEDGPLRATAISHHAASSAVADVRNRSGLAENDRMLALTGLESDLFVFDVFGLLGAGGTLVLSDTIRVTAPETWGRKATEHGITVWNGPSAVLDDLLTADALTSGEALVPTGLRLALVSGDRVSADLPARLRATTAHPCRFISLGHEPAVGIWAAAYEAGDAVPEDRSSLPYGEPLAGRRHRVVHVLGHDCPVWVPGELWVGSEDSPDSFGENSGGAGADQWHRTGVRARYRTDGTLEVLGSADRQVKIRGRRVELAELEAAMETHPGIVRAVALTVGEQKDPRLHAVVVAPFGLPADLTRHVAALLPPHALPGGFTAVERLPLDTDGRIDRPALAAYVADQPGAGTEPSGPVEKKIAAVWADLLGTQVTDRHVNFFGEGGDSLTALRLVAAVNEAFGVEVPVRSFLAASTLADLAAQVEIADSIRTTEESGVI